MKQRDEAQGWLARVASGELVLPAAKEVAQNAAVGIGGSVVGADRVLTRKELKNL